MPLMPLSPLLIFRSPCYAFADATIRYVTKGRLMIICHAARFYAMSSFDADALRVAAADYFATATLMSFFMLLAL